jgi:hypothetical protein
MGGDTQTTGGTLILKLPYNFSTDIVVKKDGNIFKTIRANNKRELALPVSQAGVYRPEISLASGRFKKLPWIIANPIFIAQPVIDKKSPENTLRKILADRENYFRTEKNIQSSATKQWSSQEDSPPVTSFKFTLQPEKSPPANFWTALAHRGKLDGSDYQGFIFEARGSSKMRFWLQFRTGCGQEEAAFQHSFLVKEQWRKIAIPFSSFHHLYGQSTSPDPACINAFFFLIDNGNAFPGAQGKIFFRQIGLY